MKIGVIGLGYWGPNLVRNLLIQKNVTGVVCYDMNQQKLLSAKQRFPMIEIASDFQSLLKNQDNLGV